jgi:hypothetical protein
LKLLFILEALLVLVSSGCHGDEPEDLHARGRTSCEIAGDRPADPQATILFGDLHAHTSNSLDGVLITLPVLDGRPYGPMDACRFARYCAQLDFWSINDHVEEQVAAQWQENLEAIRSCNDLFAGYTHQPEMVSFVGWEWTQSADVAEEDQGHHNIVLKHTCDGAAPGRPFAAPISFAGADLAQVDLYRMILIGLDPEHEELYNSVFDRVRDFEKKPVCDPSTSTLELPPDCHEVADSTVELYRKLDRWETEALVIPHGTVWGTHHPQLTSWEPFFSGAYRSPRYSPLVEVYSGHGSSETYQSWRHAERDASGKLVCPAPTPDFEPCCWRAGEIARDRSQDCASEPDGQACRDAVEKARQDFLALGKKGITSIADAGSEDWLDCGQCHDCFQPALSPRPERSIQAALAMTNFDDPARPWRYVFGMIGSTDSHRAGPGAGYKELVRMSDIYGPAKAEYDFVVRQVASQVDPDIDRFNSFLYSGGLVAVHATGRSREAIWEALTSRRVYATSGERIELWFDLVNGPGSERQPMGSVVTLKEAPRFEVRALGAFKQAPGCPGWVREATSDQLIEEVCFSECYNPTGERHRITRIEVVKVTPQIRANEPLAALVQDPYAVLTCKAGATDCTVTFQDEAYPTAGRPATYYVRAIQEPTMQVNAAMLRCERDAGGACTKPRVCEGGTSGADDDCLAEDEERAWSSPIYVAPP